VPRAMYEILSTPPRFEGVDLRGWKVARGVLRWFRLLRRITAPKCLAWVLKTAVKNAVIVPVGPKGWFCAPAPALGGNRGRDSAGSELGLLLLFIKGCLDSDRHLHEGQGVAAQVGCA